VNWLSDPHILLKVSSPPHEVLAREAEGEEASDSRSSGGFMVHKWERFDLPGVPDCGLGLGMSVGTLVGVRVDIFTGRFVGVGLDVISGVVDAFVGVVIILGVLVAGLFVGTLLGTLVGAGVDMMVYRE
jgi:hypothetical protein